MTLMDVGRAFVQMQRPVQHMNVFAEFCYTFVEKYNFPKELYIRCVEQKERPRSSLSAFFSCTYLTANSNTPDADMADSIRGVLRRSRISRVMKIGVNDKKSVGSVKANMAVRINVIVSSF